MLSLMTNNLLENNAKSALTHEKSPTLVGERYGFIDTSTIVSRFENQGFNLIKANESIVRNEERKGFQKHLLTFEHPTLRFIDNLSKDNESRLRIILKNSHDGTSSMELIASVFRLACLNGLMVSSGSIGKVRVIHSGNAIKRLDDALEDFTHRIPLVASKVQAMQATMLTNEQALNFADQASKLRLEKTEHDFIDLKSVLRVRRLQDRHNDLFSVFNRIQESVIKGGISYRKTVKQNNVDVPQWRTSRAVNSIDQSVKLNRELWAIAENFVA